MGSSSSKTIEDISGDDIATFVGTLGNNFKVYEASVRDAHLNAKELAAMTDEGMERLLESMSITNRLHRRKLISVCRKQFKTNDDGDCDTCSTTSSIFSTSSPTGTKVVGGLPAALLNNDKPTMGARSVASEGAASFGTPMLGQFENMCVEQSAEALGLLVKMENQKRLLSHNNRPSGPPEGKAAIVLTDVQGSTSLWEANPKAMRAALNVHDDIIRALRADNGGYEVDTEGDAFFLAFHSAKDALNFALGLQEALREADWSDDILALPDACEMGPLRGLRVRMGIHMGPVTTRRNAVTGRLEYTGKTMEKAREVEGMADGGQILVTRTTFNAACIAARIQPAGDGIVQVLYADRRGQRGSAASAGMASVGSGTSICSMSSMSSMTSLARSSSRQKLNGRDQKRLNSQNKSVVNATFDLNRGRRRPARAKSCPEAAEALKAHTAQTCQ